MNIRDIPGDVVELSAPQFEFLSDTLDVFRIGYSGAAWRRVCEAAIMDLGDFHECWSHEVWQAWWIAV